MAVRTLASLAVVFALSATTTRGQAPAGYSQTVAQPAAPASSGYERISGTNNPALRFYGGGRPLQYTASVNRTAMPAPRPVNTAPMSKPFAYNVQSANVSPYLALDVQETATSVPSYYAFVRPQLDQHQMNQVQQAEYRKLQQQVRTASAAGAVLPSTSGGIPTTGHSTQFQNYSGFYAPIR